MATAARECAEICKLFAHPIGLERPCKPRAVTVRFVIVLHAEFKRFLHMVSMGSDSAVQRTVGSGRGICHTNFGCGTCSKVMGEGGDSALGWARQLEADTGIEPLWEVLFQLAAHPVPQVTDVIQC